MNPYKENPKIRMVPGRFYVDRDGHHHVCICATVGNEGAANVQYAQCAHVPDEGRSSTVSHYRDGWVTDSGQDRAPWIVEEVDADGSPIVSNETIDIRLRVAEDRAQHYAAGYDQLMLLIDEAGFTVASGKLEPKTHDIAFPSMKKIPLSSGTVSDPSAGPHNRFNAYASSLLTTLADLLLQDDAKELRHRAVIDALKTIYYEGRRDGERDAKATWGEAIEETDEQRAFRVADGLFGDRLISGNRSAVEKRYAVALAESRALGMLAGVHKAVPYSPDSGDGQAARRIVDGRAFTDETIGDDMLRQSPHGFVAELEKQRKAIESITGNCAAPKEMRLSEREQSKVVQAVQFLLAVAHQPVPGGVVEVGGSSPAHEYTASKRAKSPEEERRLAEFKALRELEQTIRSNNPTPGTMAHIALENIDALRERMSR